MTRTTPQVPPDGQVAPMNPQSPSGDGEQVAMVNQIFNGDFEILVGDIRVGYFSHRVDADREARIINTALSPLLEKARKEAFNDGLEKAAKKIGDAWLFDEDARRDFKVESMAFQHLTGRMNGLDQARDIVRSLKSHPEAKP